MTRNKKNGCPKKICFNPKGSPINGGFFLAPGENPSIQGPRRQWNFTREDWNFVIRHWGKSENGVPGIPPIPLSGPSLSIMPLTYHGCLESMDVSICFISAKFFPRLFEKKFPLEEIPVVGDGNPSFFTHPLNCWCYLPQAKSVVRVLTGIANQSTPEKPD